MKDSYSDLVAAAMRRQDLDMRGLESATDYSYEHLRKILAGEPVVSQECNQKICLALGLNIDAMWELATREKAFRRYGHAAKAVFLPPADPRLREIWSTLSDDQKNRLVTIAHGMSTENQAMRS